MNQTGISAPAGISKPTGLLGLKGRLTLSFSLLFITILVFILVTGFTGISLTPYEGRQGEYKEQAFRTLNFVADMKKDWLLNWISERSFDVGIIAANEFVRSSAAQLSEALPRNGMSAEGTQHTVRTLRDHPSYRPFVRYLQQFGSLHKMYMSISVAEPRTGMIIASSTEELVGEDASPYPVFRRALADHRASVGDILPEPPTGLPVLRFGQALRDEQGEIIAVVLVAVDVDDILKPVLHTGIGLGRTGEALLVDENHVVLVSLKFPLADGSVAEPFRYRNYARPAMLAAGGQEGSIEAEDYRGVPVFAAHRHIRIQPDKGWGMVVKVDRSEILEPMWTDMKSSLILGVIGLICVVVLAAVTATRIVQPILRLTLTASRFTAGDGTVRSGLRRRDEIGILASTFDLMADRIDSDWRDLEDRAERLRVSKEALQVRQRVQASTMAVSNVLASAPALDELLESALDELLRKTDCHMGAIYLRDETSADRLKLSVASGIDPDKGGLPSVAAIGEGSIGLAARRREMVVLKELSEGSHFVFATVAGGLLPRFIVNAPLIHKEDVIGVLTLAGVHPEAPESLEIVEMSRNPLAIAITNAQAHSRTRRLAEELRLSNEELQAANEELTIQSEELQAQAEELREQAAELETRRIRVEEADRLKSEFLSNMSHELRTPLNSILALSQLMMRRGTGKDASEEAEYLQVIERNGRQLLGLINDLLDLAKIESGRMLLNLAQVAPRRVVERVVETIRPLADAKNLAVTVIMAEVPVLRTDEEKLLQILLNLLSNAVKFTDSGTLEIAVAGAADRVTFTVKDSGIGIESHHLVSIFDEFRQADGSTTRKYQGTGLGLAIARKLARMLGGDITVESEPGRGSSFTLTIPIFCGPEVDGSNVPPDAQPDLERSARIPGQTNGVSPRPRSGAPLILLVEDNEIAALQIHSILEKKGYSVQRVSRGAEAIAIAGQSVPDAIILDLLMPDVDGFQVLEEIRKIPSTSRVPVLVLTAKDITAEDLKRLRHNNIHQLVQKGNVNRDQLLAIIGSIFTARERSAHSAAEADGESAGGDEEPPILVEEEK